MSTYHDLPKRNARDRMLDLLFVETKPMLSFPLTDIPAIFYSKVPAGMTTVFYLLGGQESVEYTLYEQAEDTPVLNEGEVITGTLLPLDLANETLWNDLQSLSVYPRTAGNSIRIPGMDEDAERQVFADTWRYVVQFESPVFEEDCSFRVQIQKPDTSGTNTYLSSHFLAYEIPFKVGLETALAITFSAQNAPGAATLIDAGEGLLLDFGTSDLEGVGLSVLQAQNHISYQVQEHSPNPGVLRSEIVTTIDEQSSVDLVLNDIPFDDDTVLEVRAFRNTLNDDGDEILEDAILDQTVAVVYRPNLEAVVRLKEDKNILAYGGSTSIYIDDYESDVDYQLYSHQLILEEYRIPSQIDLETMQFSPINLLEDPAIENISPLALMNVEGIDAGEQVLEFITSALYEDTVLLIKASKAGETHLLQASVLCLIQPDPTPEGTLDTDEESISLEHTQAGVSYQLQSSIGTDLREIGNPAYHHTDRGLSLKRETDRRTFGTRIGIDFRVGYEAGDATSVYAEQIILPIDTLDEGATLNILATKTYTGLTETLNYSIENPSAS